MNIRCVRNYMLHEGLSVLRPLKIRSRELNYLRSQKQMKKEDELRAEINWQPFWKMSIGYKKIKSWRFLGV